MLIQLKAAIDLLNQNKVVAIPTETVYGLAGRIDSHEALKLIFHVKERPFFDPLIVHISDLNQLTSIVSDFPLIANALGRAFWPGPLTLILPKFVGLDPLITSGLDSVGVRMPKHPLTQELIRHTGPLAAPSANKFGKTSPTRSEHVEAEFSGSVATLDGGATDCGIESTVLRIEGTILEILRPGLITEKDIDEVLIKEGLKYVWGRTQSKFQHQLVAPGILENHYQPAIPLVIFTQESQGELTLEEFWKKVQEHLLLAHIRPQEVHLDPDATLAARELYHQLRTLSSSGANVLWVRENSLSHTFEWAGIWDRLRKASTQKI